MMRAAFAACWAATLLAAYVLGGASARSRPVPVLASVQAEQVRAIVRGEIARVAPCRTPPVESIAAAAPAQVVMAPVAPERPAPPDEAIEAHARALDRVDQAIARRAWGVADRDALRAELQSLTPEQTEDILRVLIPAINDGRVVLDGNDGPL